MYDKFRVICCENREKYPGKLFIDIYPADHITHELLYRMRLRVTPDVHDITGGVYLDDLGGGEIRLKYIKHYDKMLQKQQAEMRALIDPQISKLFYEMKKRGITRTINASLADAYEIFNIGMIYPKSAKEEEFMRVQEQRRKREQILKEREAYYAQQKYAGNPHIGLMIKQLERRGD